MFNHLKFFIFIGFGKIHFGCSIFSNFNFFKKINVEYFNSSITDDEFDLKKQPSSAKIENLILQSRYMFMFDFSFIQIIQIY